MAPVSLIIRALLDVKKKCFVALKTNKYGQNKDMLKGPN